MSSAINAPFNGLQIKRINLHAIIPERMTDLSSGVDLHACLPGGHSLHVMMCQVTVVSTGIAVAIPKGFEGQVRMRSGLSAKHGIMLVNGLGTIDADYRGEIKVLLTAIDKPYEIKHGRRIAQLVLCPVVQMPMKEVRELPETERGTDGLGSTGV